MPRPRRRFPTRPPGSRANRQCFRRTAMPGSRRLSRRSHPRNRDRQTGIAPDGDSLNRGSEYQEKTERAARTATWRKQPMEYICGSTLHNVNTLCFDLPQRCPLNSYLVIVIAAGLDATPPMVTMTVDLRPAGWVPGDLPGPDRRIQVPAGKRDGSEYPSDGRGGLRQRIAHRTDGRGGSGGHWLIHHPWPVR